MRLASPQSAILSAVIFNALIIVALIPLALARRALPPARRGGAAAPHPAHLRPGRRRGAVRGHQAHRHAAEPRRARLTEDTLKKELVVALRMTLATFVLTGLVYPLVVTGVAQVLFPWRANGSVVSAQGRVVGSELIGQGFKSPAYFQSRPSAAGTDGYDAANSSGSNLGPTSQKLRDRVAADVARLRTENPQAPAAVPVELVTTSASGFDPHLSPEAARWQVPRVAAAAAERGRRPRPRRADRGTHLRPAGRASVNVLQLNLDLDQRFGLPGRQPRVARCCALNLDLDVPTPAVATTPAN